MPAKTASRKSRLKSAKAFDDSAYSVNLPENVKARIAGIGELPSLGNIVTLKDIQMAIRTSEIGEPLYLFSLFRDMIENDSHMQAEIGKRIMSFMGQDESIEPLDKDDADDVAAKEVIEDMIANCENWPQGSVHLANGHIWPVAAAEKIYEPIKGEDAHKWRHPVKYRLKKLFPVPYALFTYKVAYQNLGGIIGSRPGSGFNPSMQSGTGAAPMQDVIGHSAATRILDVNKDPDVLVWNPDDWQPDLRFYSTLPNGLINWDISASYKADKTRHVVHSANVATSSMRENFGSLLRSNVPWWFYKMNLRDWMARSMERYGSPFAVAYANTSNKNVFDLLTKAFNQATKVNALIVPPQAKIELKEVQVTSMADAFVKCMECCAIEQTKSILGQTLSTTSKGSGMMGGSGVADLHGEVRSEWTQYDKRRYAQMQWQQIFEPFLRVNGYSGRVKSVRGGLSPMNLSIISKTFQALSLAGIFVDESAEQDLTSMFGIKMKIKDITEMQNQKLGKSKSDRKENE